MSAAAMVIAQFKDLCIDAHEPAVLAPFWGSVLGLGAELLDDGDGKLSGPTRQDTVWINRVPEMHTVKNRVHLDVAGLSIHECERLGATRLSEEGEFPWIVMSDPEGGEFCLFLRDKVPAQCLEDVVVDAVDSARIAAWWAKVFGKVRKTDESGGYHWVEDIPGAPVASFDFVPVPEPKTVKNRIHWDVTVSDVRELLAAGATMVRRRGGEIVWDVLADPEGNEFCAFEL